jgi:hypothetical protein
MVLVRGGADGPRALAAEAVSIDSDDIAAS